MITLRFALPGDFLQVYDASLGALGGVFFASKKPPAVHGIVKVHLRFFDGKTFRTRCKVESHVHAGPHQPGGAWLSFLPSEWKVRDLAVTYASGQDIPYSPRRHQRVAARMPARVRVGNTDFQATTEDISSGGARIRTTRRVPKGASGKLTVKVPGRLFPVTVDVVVARSGPGGELGLRLAEGHGRRQRRFESMVEDAKEGRGAKK